LVWRHHTALRNPSPALHERELHPVAELHPSDGSSYTGHGQTVEAAIPMNYLDFEKPLAEIEGKAEELRALARQNAEMDVEQEAAALDKKADDLLRDLYTSLTPWRKCQVARHPERPHCSITSRRFSRSSRRWPGIGISPTITR
jgi:hypothetical protein